MAPAKKADKSKAFARGMLTASLAAGAAYFVGMTTAHFFSLKYPVLFVYWDTPFHAYQDKIISFCAALYALVFINAARDPAVVPTAVGSMVITTVGLSLVNVSDELAAVLAPGQTTQWYWAQTAMIGAIGAWVAFWAKKAGAL
jgi:hypothetical protein